MSSHSSNKADASAKYFGRDLEGMSFARNYHREIIRHFGDDIGKKVLEVGAGSGNFSEFIRESGVHEHVTIEPSENMFPCLFDRFHDGKSLRAFRCILKDLPASEREFDSIFYVNVLEHIEDAQGELKHAFDRLAKGGKLLIFIPALPWLFGTADERFGHHRRYYKKELIALVESAGFRVKRSRYFDIFGVVPWWVLFVLLRRPCFSASNVALYDRIVIPVASVFGRKLAPPVGKNVLLVAVK